jgi:phosphoglucan,water dikinase
LLRTLASLSRARRLAEGYADRINELFPPFVEEIGRALGVADHAIKVFSEGDIRAHLIFQLARLVDVGLRASRQELNLPPWEAIVPGEAAGTLVRAADLSEVEGRKGPLIVLLDHVDGDAEVPLGVKGLAVGHPLPHLSHLGVRARQARVPFAASAGREYLGDFGPFLGKYVRFRVGPDGPEIQPESPGPAREPAREKAPLPAIPEVTLPGAEGVSILSLSLARPETSGGKANAARMLLELAERSAGLFRAPRGLVVPFGVMERALAEQPQIQEEYLGLVARLSGVPHGEMDPLLARLRDLVCSLRVPGEVVRAAAEFFGSARLAVRSSANGEDLEHFAGAGLYESVVNVPSPDIEKAVVAVWASLWTRRAALGRAQAGLGHDRIRMAVLLQELVNPDVSFILHTAHPLTGSREVALAELAVGLGETLASSAAPGTPYRLECLRQGGQVRLLTCASFSTALKAGRDGGKVEAEVIDYSQVPLSRDPGVGARLGRKLAEVADFLEGELGRPQDVEGAILDEDLYLVQARAQQGL